MSKSEVQFVVTVRSAEPPPDWAGKIEKQLVRQCRYLFGLNNVTVERLGEQDHP